MPGGKGRQATCCCQLKLPTSSRASQGCDCVRNAGALFSLRSDSHPEVESVLHTATPRLLEVHFPLGGKLWIKLPEAPVAVLLSWEAPRAYLWQPLLILLPAVVRGQAVIGLVPGDGPRAPWWHHWQKRNPENTKSDLLFKKKKKKLFK